METVHAPSVTTTWRKGSRSQGISNCVEVGENPQGRVALHDSKNPTGPAFVMPKKAFGQLARLAANTS